ncbi:MAG TPA: hypothetical protein VMT90_08570 [Dehalococcoidia bacterium]|jgi:hypothetical protein|nr:hypothetical protein [Dehalococcoidia bacterium]
MHDEVDIVPMIRRVQAMPYVWPAPPDAASARAAGAGSCASKHALLAEELLAAGIESLPLLVVGPLVPRALADDPDVAAGRLLPEVHECLTVLTPWAGPLRVDVTWDPPLIARGLPGTLDWDGHTDMLIAVGEGGPCWSVPREGLRQAKEALRARLYRDNEREVRDRTLAAIARRFNEWRSA